MGPSVKLPTLGLIIVLLSIPLLILNWVSVSVLLLFAGIIVMAIPEIQVRRQSSLASRMKGEKTVESRLERSQMDSCVLCGKPVAKGVAYCPECLKSSG